ncbi:hypothetical protein Tco_1317827 [Tanacetum coccineum]
MLKVSPQKGEVCFAKWGKLNLDRLDLSRCWTVPLDGLHFDDKLQFVEEPVEIVDREVKRLRKIRVPIVQVRWNSKRGPEFTWECEDKFKKKYPHLFTKTASSSSAASIGGDKDMKSIYSADLCSTQQMTLSPQAEDAEAVTTDESAPRPPTPYHLAF